MVLKSSMSAEQHHPLLAVGPASLIGGARSVEWKQQAARDARVAIRRAADREAGRAVVGRFEGDLPLDGPAAVILYAATYTPDVACSVW